MVFTHRLNRSAISVTVAPAPIIRNTCRLEAWLGIIFRSGEGVLLSPAEWNRKAEEMPPD